MQLSENIRAYYFAHFDELNTDKRFHFCTRLAAWDNDERARYYLRQLRPVFVPDPCTKASLEKELRELIENPPSNLVNARGLRDRYFEKYPRLRGIDFALFRVRHLEEAYAIDARPALFDLISREDLMELKDNLLNDSEAVRILSTYVVNYVYLLERVILKNNTPEAVDAEKLYDLGDTYDTTNPQHLQLLIYLYTHCIIGETNFYVRPIPEPLLPVYHKMLVRLEEVIREHFTDINLDNKLEFLVCCRIVGYKTALHERIWEECSRSLSAKGTFLVDRHNSNRQSDKSSLADSEHRNVLFILSCSEFTPHSIHV